MEAYVFSQALREFVRFRRLAPWLGLSGLTFIMGFYWHYLLEGATNPQIYGDVSTLMVFRILPLASAIYTTAIIGQEVEQKTIVYLLTRTIPRAKLLLLRFAASVVVVFGISMIAALSVSIAVFKGGALGNPLLFKDMLAIGLGALGYGALFLFISLLFNRAMLICLLFSFGWETSVPNMPGSMSRLSITSYVQAIAEHPSTGTSNKLLALASGTLGTNDLTSQAGITALLLVTAVGVVLSAQWFTRFEFVPREDAE